MSWKNFVSAGLMCVLASPVFADPTLSVIKGGTAASSYLNANGDWVWNIEISNSNPVPTGSSPLAAELGFTASGSALKSASNLSTGAGVDFDTVNPGKSIFGWEANGTGTNNNPEGLQVNVPTNQVFSALGSVDYATVGPHNYIQIITRGPSGGIGGSLTSTLTTSGAYGGKGRIAEALTATTSANYDTYSNAFTRTALAGDVDLNGIVNGGDLNLVLSHFNQTTTKWFEGNLTNAADSVVNGGDLNLVLSTFNQTNSIGAGAGGGLTGGGAVPEPASVALISLALLGGMGLIGRKR